ncbi:Ubiquitin carboxyl-terminal hydrolase family protein [Theobroma cacao]|uniref:Ubiquitin carboxyl-terminal hydrolase family protein n=1 Tax=Theobroma cacao TaxID=3641 RepID=A0A061FIJ3_THECC|nr:Ubiquitin carboxyl-terminal hydrolase family protein [Theobroma cacao]
MRYKRLYPISQSDVYDQTSGLIFQTLDKGLFLEKKRHTKLSAMISKRFFRRLGCCYFSLYSQPSLLYHFRNFSLWSMRKDLVLESALSRNRRWIVNNQIKNIILRYPNQVAPLKHLQKKFKTLDLQGKALNWLRKYPCCFEVYLENDEYHCRLTKRMMHLVEEEESVKDMQEPVFVQKLAKLLMMSMNQRLNVMKLNELKHSFGFPDDYVIRILPKYPDMFRLVNSSWRKSSMEIELLAWSPDLAVSAVEASAQKQGLEPCFSCSLPSTWVKSWQRFQEFNAIPYISPYSNSRGLEEGSKEMEKRIVCVVHELLSLTLWKKLSIVKLGHFKREFALPVKLNVLLLKHPGIFYVSNKYQIYTVLLRESYNGPELVHKDPLVIVKNKFGELMQEGLHEYNQSRYLVNLEKKRNGMNLVKAVRRKDGRAEMSDQDDSGDKLGGLFDPEERKRFYKVLFDEGAP